MPLCTTVGLGLGHIVLDGDPAAPKRGTAHPPISAHVCCGQTARWIKMPLGTEVGLDPSDILLDGGTQLPLKRGTSPTFQPVYCGQTVTHLSYLLLRTYVVLVTKISPYRSHT